MHRLLAGVIISAVLSASLSARGQLTVVPDTSRAIHVTGRGSTLATPDTASAEVGVSMVDPDAKKAKANVDAAIARIVLLAQSLGIQERALKTAPVNIEPRYDEENPTRLRGYEVTRSVTAMLTDLAKLDAFLDGAVQAGANRNFDVNVTSSRAEDLKREALTLAIEDAKKQAELAVRQLGVRLGAVRSINLNRAADSFGTVSASRAVVVPGARFLPGTIRVAAEVTVTFSLDDVSLR